MTNPKDFKRFLSMIPADRKDKMWFIPIRKDKRPDCKQAWKENYNIKLSSSDAYHRLKNGQNVGIVALQGNLMFLDLDVSKGKFNASPLILDALELNPTMTIRTRNGGIQKYFLNDGKYANQLLKENDTVIGELRTNWQYVVSVGSYVEPDENNFNGDGYYRLVDENVPISHFQGLCVEGFQELTLMTDEIRNKPNRIRTKKEIDFHIERSLTLSDEEHTLITAGYRRVMI